MENILYVWFSVILEHYVTHFVFRMWTWRKKQNLHDFVYSKAIVKAYGTWFVRTLSLSVSGNNRLCSALRAITWTIYRFSSRSPTSFDFLMSVPGFWSYSVGKFPLFSIISQWITLIMSRSNIYRVVWKLRIIALNCLPNTGRFFHWIGYSRSLLSSLLFEEEIF